MTLLRQAAELGYGDLELYETDEALDPLRSRPEFQAWLKQRMNTTTLPESKGP
jgi:hypothetical protein